MRAHLLGVILAALGLVVTAAPASAQNPAPFPDDEFVITLYNTLIPPPLNPPMTLEYRSEFEVRPIDIAGYEHWLSVLRRGVPRLAAVKAFTTTPEFREGALGFGTTYRKGYDDMSDAYFVVFLTRALLAKPFDDRQNLWADHLRTGRMTRADLIFSMMHLPESRAAMVPSVTMQKLCIQRIGKPAGRGLLTHFGRKLKMVRHATAFEQYFPELRAAGLCGPVSK